MEMKARDYRNLREVYYRDSDFQIDRTFMVRRALVEGLSEENSDHETYSELIKRFCDVDDRDLKSLRDLINRANRTAAQETILRKRLESVKPTSEGWEPLDYDVLKDADVVIPFEGNVRELATLLMIADSHQVIQLPPEGIVQDLDEYQKHIPNRLKVFLNSAAAVKHFLRARDLYERAPASLVEGGRVTRGTLGLLEEAGFTYPAALENAYNMLRDRRGVASVFAIKLPDGNEVRIPAFSFVNGTEYYMEFTYVRGAKPRIEHGKAEEDEEQERFKYHGTNRVFLPRLIPDCRRQETEVWFQYLGVIERDRPMNLEWTHTRVNVTSNDYLNKVNFEDRRGHTTRVAHVFDRFARAALIHVATELNITPYAPEYRRMLFPTAIQVEALDKTRFHIARGQNCLRQAEQSVLMMEIYKKCPFSSMFTTKRPDIKNVLRPLYDFQMPTQQF